jgi:hypothetical protein
MSITADEILKQMTAAAEGAFKNGWSAVKDYAPAEFHKMAIQLESIARNVAAYQLDENQGYSPATGKILLKMQRHACEAVFVAVTQLTLVAVQKAMNSIFKVLKDAFGSTLAGVL